MPLSLRLAQTKDFKAIVPLMNRAFRGSGKDAGWSTEAAYIEGDRTSETSLQEELNTRPGSVLLVTDTENGSAIQGSVLLQPISQTTWYLGSLTVEPLLQKSGLGRRLLAAAEDWAAQHGASTIQMNVVNVRNTLIAWYERRGYHRTGEVHPFPYGDDRFGKPLRDDLSFVVLEKVLTKL